MIKRILPTLLLIGVLGAKAQVNVDPMDPTTAVQTLLGPGVIFSNVQFTGDPLQLGYMTGAVDPFEIPSGIGLASGAVNEAELNPPFDFLTNPVNGNADLLNIANSVPPLIGQNWTASNVNDVSILEFDFVASGNELSFDYIFGSDEYQTYINTVYNDVFGFFLSGPGITGPFSAPAGFPGGSINIAIVPGSDPELPITISSVQPNLNGEYYIDNPASEVVGINGYTTTLTAFFGSLVCGETYHIRLAIADAQDTALTSWVFLREGSFQIAATNIEAITYDPEANFPPLTVVEGCIPGEFVVNPPPCLVDTLVVNLAYSGTAIYGTDFVSSFPTTLEFLPTGEPVIVTIEPLDDDEEEAVESIVLSYTYIDLLNQPQTVSGTMSLMDYDTNEPFLQDIQNMFICPGTTATAVAIAAQGYTPYTYSWTSGETTSSVVYGEGDEGDYMVTLTDFCGYKDSVLFTVIEPDSFVVFPDVFICINEIGQLANGGAQPYIYEFLPDIATEVQGNNDRVLGDVLGDALGIVTDQCGQVDTAVVRVAICRIPNVFTPNGDSKNKFFTIEGIDQYPGSKLTVLNRWGTVVFESENYNNQWSGEDQPDGAYYYIYSRSDGEVFSGEVQILRNE